MTAVVYYLPNIPENRSTTRYNHARVIPRYGDSAVLITHPSRPPTEIAERYDDVHVLRSEGHLTRALRAKRIAEAALDEFDPEAGVYLTSFHYIPALSGWLSDCYWVLDIYDDPYQLIYHNPGTYHELGVRVLVQLLSRADRAVHTVHPATPHTFGDEVCYALNGAAVDLISPQDPKNDDGQLRGVCAGVKGRVQILIEALAASETDVIVDVYGTVDTDDRQLAARLGVADQVNFRGQQPHGVVTDAIERADIGFCLISEKFDWYYAHPIKIGEYLAGGTIPVASSYPGVRQLTRDAGVLIDYDAESVASALETVASDAELRTSLKKRARDRAQEIAWRSERQWFAKQAILGQESWQGMF